jgi:hypothetical protein
MSEPSFPMRIILLSIASLSWLLPTASAGNLLDFILPKHDVRVVTVTDTTPTGALLRPASPANPVYYVAISAGYRDFGGIIAGEKSPPKEEVTKTIAKVLAQQGYLPATQAHPPTLLILWAWGTMNVDRFYNPSDFTDEGQQINRTQLLRFLGAYKVGVLKKERDPFDPYLIQPGLSVLDADAEDIYDTSTDDLYVAMVGAYDFQAAMRKEKKLLWTTKISCPSRGLWLPEVLPTMLAIAGPYIGRETPKPVWVNATDKFKPDIKIGDPTLVEYLNSGKLPVVDVSDRAVRKPTAKKTAPAAP